MARKATRIKAPALDPAMTRADAERLLAEIGELQRSQIRMVADADGAKAEIDTLLSERLEPVMAEIEERALTLQLYAEAHREELCPKGSKTARLVTGEISWRQDPPSVRVTGEDAVIATLERLELGDLVRTKKEVNKAAILDNPARVDGIAGIAIQRREQLILKPRQTDIEPVELVRKVR